MQVRFHEQIDRTACTVRPSLAARQASRPARQERQAPDSQPFKGSGTEAQPHQSRQSWRAPTEGRPYTRIEDRSQAESALYRDSVNGGVDPVGRSSEASQNNGSTSPQHAIQHQLAQRVDQRADGARGEKERGRRADGRCRHDDQECRPTACGRARVDLTPHTTTLSALP